MKTLIVSAIIAAATLTAGTASATQAWIGKTALNARSGPGTSYHKIGTFKPCTKVHVVAHTHGWAKVRFNHNYYWVAAKYLRNSSCHKPKVKTYVKPHYVKPHYGTTHYSY